MARKRLDEKRVVRLTYPTLSLTVWKPHLDWIEAEARRRNVSKSEVVRVLVERAMAESPQQGSPA